MISHRFKKNSLIYAVFFIYLFLIILFPLTFNFNNDKRGITIENETISIRLSSSNPPNKLDFRYFKEITILEEKVSGSGNYTNFPVLISILDSDLHDDVQANGNDIAFANDTDWLDHEIEYFNKTYSETHGELIAWVRIPNLSTLVNTTIYMYYGNSTMSSRQNPTGVWDSSYKGVWHLSETSGTVNDSTSYNRAGLVSGTVTRGVDGTCDGAYDFGNNGQINYGDPSDGHLDMGTGSFTISFWINFDASTGNYQLPLYKGSTTYSEAGYDFETNQDATTMTFRICDGTDLAEAFEYDITYDTWGYVTGVVDRSSNYMRLYKDGSQVSSAVSISSIGSISNSLSLYVPTNIYDLNGLLDEIRICNLARSSGWILTEYNNQKNPGTFISVGTEIVIDNNPPFYSDLIESSNPLELGDTEVIKINVSDPSGINQVKIEFMGSNYSMTNIAGETWQYDSWTPGSVGNYSYTIWMEDNFQNWNYTTGSIEVIDTTPPSYSDLIESADPLQFGQNETISIKVYDSPGTGVNQVLIEYESLNHTMNFIGGNSWRWNNWKPSTTGLYPYRIFMQDNEKNWNMTSGTILVIDTTAPVIENLTESEDPIELGNFIIINIDVMDGETNVSTVLIEFDNVNNTMIHFGGNTYQFNLTKSIVGINYYTIYANDSDNNWNSLSSSFDIIDTTPPALSNPLNSEDPLELGNTLTTSINCTDLSDIKQVKIEFDSVNHTMTNIGGNTWQCNLSSPSTTGDYIYTIWVEDYNNNWNSTINSVFIQDTTPPNYSNLVESSNFVELGTLLTISIDAFDLSNIKDVLIEFEGSNHTMTNIGGNVWNFDSWIPNSIGNYSYKIYLKDNNDNLNSLSSWILFFDSILPDCDYLFENADPLELGDNQIIRINAYDFAGINQCLLEYEGSNHSMTNIYGNTWQFDSWIPNNWTYYQYKIFIEDRSGNWNYMLSNMTVQDTISPSPPVLTNGPSGIVSGVLVFDWQEGFDPSGITGYVLIIDNETDPSTTPGYIFEVNLTNNGSGSSYFELTEELPSGKYYYFLAQTDGAGHKSSYTVGSFEIQINDNNNNNNLMMYIIIAIAIVSVLGSVSAIVVIKRRSQKKMKPFRKKIPLKVTLSHIKAISPVIPSSYEEKTQNLINKQPITHDTFKEEILVEEEQLLNIEELKHLGENMFEEGAYLEAIDQFEYIKELLIEQGRKEEATLYSELINGIDTLIKEREIRTKVLEAEKMNGETLKIFELYQEIIEISKKLRDNDGVKMYNSEMNDYFKANKVKLIELQKYGFKLEEQADISLNAGQYEKAAQEFEKCEKISELLLNYNKHEINNVEKFKNKKLECLKKLNEE